MTDDPCDDICFGDLHAFINRRMCSDTQKDSVVKYDEVSYNWKAVGEVAAKIVEGVKYGRNHRN